MPSYIEPIIVNVIASSRVSSFIDVEALTEKLVWAEYNPEVFPGLILKRRGKPTMIMFAGGKISSHGGKSETSAKDSILKMFKELKTLNCIDQNATLEEIKIVNIVATASLGCDLDLESVVKNVNNVIYEPEQFPGLIFRDLNNKVVSLIFSNGKLNLVGAKSSKSVNDSFNKVRLTLNKYCI
jgi:transcription initiation factor TFIID TATA-box-binding protein